MVKLYALSVLYKPTNDVPPVLLKASYDLQQFSFFQRSSVQEFMAFTTKIITERCSIGTRQSVKEQGKLGNFTAASGSSDLGGWKA